MLPPPREQAEVFAAAECVLFWSLPPPSVILGVEGKKNILWQAFRAKKYKKITGGGIGTRLNLKTTIRRRKINTGRKK